MRDPHDAEARVRLLGYYMRREHRTPDPEGLGYAHASARVGTASIVSSARCTRSMT